jgi:acetyl coenzyme A synthetase (ADP forming)-like protein
MKKSHLLPQLYQDSVESGRLILRDGSTATVHVAKPEDREAIREFFRHLSPESRYTRFFSMAEPDESLLDSFCNPNPHIQLSLVVTRIVSGASRIIAVGTYVSTDSRNAEVAVAVDDTFHGKGLGTLLLERLALLAVRHGFAKFWATTNSSNLPMAEIFRNSGFPVNESREDSYLRFDFSILPTKASILKSEMMDRAFTYASILPFFEPSSIAVIGASRDPSSLGFLILEELVRNHFQGPVYPVNPKASVVGSMRAYPSVKDLPEPVDLAVLVIAANRIPDVVDECAERGVKAVVVVTAGFAEAGADGLDLQQKVLDKVRGHGMRMVGPNCMGIINTDPRVQMNASFSPVFPPAGRVAMSSQSGALGVAILAVARDRRLGFSTFISVGNKADVSGNDLLQYWEEDPGTDVILLYLESFGNPRRFSRIARRVSRSKPIVCVKGGRSSAGKRAAGSHTAAMAVNDVAVEALFRQTGVVHAETLEEMFDLAALLGSQPPPQGRRVGIITNAGGPGILCTDTCEAHGLVVPEFSKQTRTRLAKFLPPAASAANPVDMIASADPQQYKLAVETVLKSGDVDAVIVIYIPVAPNLDPFLAAIGEGVAEARRDRVNNKPVLACLMTKGGAVAPIQLNGERIPAYAFPEAAARVLGKAAVYAEWRQAPLGITPDFADIDAEKARCICRTALSQRGDGWLSTEEARMVLAAMKLPLPAGGVATSAAQAVQIAQSIGYPVAVKLASHQIIHKTEMGGVRLNLADDAAVRRAFDQIEKLLSRKGKADAMEGVLIQPMLSEGVELMIGVAADPLFGPLIAFGLGGIYVEILQDVCFRITPLTDRDASEMIASIKGYRLLQGYRGHQPADVKAIEEALLRVSRLVEEVPEISELDLNPVFAFAPGKGCSIVDARIHVKSPAAGGTDTIKDSPQRSLSTER